VQLRQRWERLREALSMGWKEICATPKMRYKSRVLKHNRKEDRNQEFHSHHEKAGIQMQTEWKKRKSGMKSSWKTNEARRLEEQNFNKERKPIRLANNFWDRRSAAFAFDHR
jgi:hypothetical protein